MNYDHDSELVGEKEKRPPEEHKFGPLRTNIMYKTNPNPILTMFLYRIFVKDFMEQQQHDFSDSTSRAGSDSLQKTGEKLAKCITIYVH